MKNQLANYFDIVPREDVSSIDGSSVNLKAGKTLDRINTKNNVTVLDKPAEQSGNPYFEQSSKMVCSKLGAELSTKYRSKRPVIVILYYTDTTVLVWGDITSPVRVNLNPEITHDVLELFRKSVDSLL